VTVLVVVVTLVVVIIVVVTAPLWTLSVVEIGGFFTTCCFAASAGTGLSRQWVLTSFRSFVRKSCGVQFRKKKKTSNILELKAYRRSCIASLEAQGHLGMRKLDSSCEN
jgi:hypothetical protein